jgi:hypothetical protein
MNFSDYMEQALLGATILGSTYTSADTVYFALGTSLSTVGSEITFTEVTTNLAYERLAIDFSAPTSGPTWSCVNSTTLAWSPATTPWGGVVVGAIFDAETIGTGNMLYWGEPTTVRSVGFGQIFEIAAGDLTILLD